MLKPLPTDTHTFSGVVTSGKVYVDKTALIAQLAAHGKYYFLSRPRRFGKSLLTTTMLSLYQGHKDLFAGLAVEHTWDWKTYPAMRFDFSEIGNESPEQFKYALREMLISEAKSNGYQLRFDPVEGVGDLLVRTVTSLHALHGQKVVLLVDEYDKPITDRLEEPTLANANREALRSFFTAAKGLDDHLQFVFITGVSKFAKTSVFSGLNNPVDLTLDPHYNALCGFTQTEVETYFAEHITKMSQHLGMTREGLLDSLQKRYDGYSWNGTEKVYNPFSVIRALASQELKSFWFSSGTTTFLVRELRKRQRFPIHFQRKAFNERMLDAAAITKLSPEALLFQTGYLTVVEKKLDRKNLPTYVLDFPNEEVREAFFADLLDCYAKTDPGHSEPDAEELYQLLAIGNTDAAGKILRRYVAKIPGKLHIALEAYYQSLIYMILSLAGMRVDLEKWQATGILDGTLEFSDRVYIMEFKFSDSGTPEAQAAEAIRCIRKRKYALAWQDEGKAIYAWGLGVAGRALGWDCKLLTKKK